VEVALGGERVRQEPVGDLAGRLGHELAHAGEEDLGLPKGFGPGSNIGS